MTNELTVTTNMLFSPDNKDAYSVHVYSDGELTECWHDLTEADWPAEFDERTVCSEEIARTNWYDLLAKGWTALGDDSFPENK